MANVKKDGSAAKVRAEQVTDAEFITVYCEVHKSGGTVQDVADKLGYSKASVQAKAHVFRNERGLKALPKFERGAGGGSKFDFDASAALLADLMGIDVEDVSKVETKETENESEVAAETDAQ